jgi:hypothetical protein
MVYFAGKRPGFEPKSPSRPGSGRKGSPAGTKRLRRVFPELPLDPPLSDSLNQVLIKP